MVPREILERCFRAAVTRANPEEATHRAVAGLQFSESPWIIALGKGATAMARGAVAALQYRGLAPAGGIVVSVNRDDVPAPLLSVPGDHPVPGPRSANAAARLGDVVASMPASATVLVLLSGGTTSLAAAPVEGVPREDLRPLFDALLASGADITTMNALRKRVLRWGGGRLARALAPRRVHCLVVSDVIGNDLAAIGSGPCVPDSLAAADLAAMMEAQQLDSVLPSSIRDYLTRVRRGSEPETPKPGEPDFDRVSATVVLDVRSAITAAADAAFAAGVSPVRVGSAPLTGDAAAAGAALAEEAAALRDSLAPSSLGTAGAAALVHGGETTVRLRPGAGGIGGRCQELALAAARALHELGPRGRGITLLAAGTDGRDGPTDAAGAVVDASTWTSLSARGFDPERALATHNTFPALDAVRALLRTGPTGTNVNDLVMALITLT